MEEEPVDPPKIIEVERKFVVTPDCEERLKKHGGELLGTKKFLDIYYDTKNYDLTLNDHWLRQRDGKWQLKFPIKSHDLKTQSTQYEELDDESQISSQIAPVLKSDKVLLQTLVDQKKITDFSRISTERINYGLSNFTIVFDYTDFGFRVGEIERIVVSEDRVSVAVKEIDELAEKLGLQPLTSMTCPELCKA